MHLLIPFAAPLSQAGREALRTLAWPGLRQRWAGLQEISRDEGDELSLSPPHERAQARALGWQGSDGAWPFAAWALSAQDAEPGAMPWGLATPAHWHLGTEQISLGDPAALSLDDGTSRALLAAVEPLFTSEGFTVRWGAATSWFLSHPALAALPCASLDRVIGRNIDRWLPATPEARLLRRLQNEVQMLLYTHPLNAEREARGLLPVNSFWLSGCGAMQPASGPLPVVDTRLRGPALAEDWAGWAKAWQQIDEELVLAGFDQLTLCGERSSVTFAARPPGLWQRLSARWRAGDLPTILEAL